MKIKVLLVSLLACIAASCSNDDDAQNISGTWKLTNAAVTDGVNLQYSDGQVEWKFNEHSHTLTVTNNILTTGPENIYSGLPTGNYNYSIQSQNGMNVLYVSGNEQGALAATNDNLVINTNPQQANSLTKVFRR